MSSVTFSPEVLTIIMIVGLVLGIFKGFPIGFVMLGISLIVGLLGAGPSVIEMMLQRTYSTMTEYILAAIPLFVFMGVMLEISGSAEKLFLAVQICLGKLRGALYHTVIIICTLMAMCTGIVGSTVTVMGIFALPSMLKNGYDKALSAGTICAAGTLGILIPPSIMLVIYAPMAGISVIHLLAGAFIPGFILSALFIIFVAIRCAFNPKLGPPLPLEKRDIQTKQKLILVLTSLFPPFFLILACLGSIFFGIASVTEAAAAGAAASFILTAAYGKMNWSNLKLAAYRTLKVTAMIQLITFAAFVFTGSFMMIGGKDVTTKFLLGLPLSKESMFFLMMFTFFILGFFMEWIGIIPILVPILNPVIKELGFDPIWFAICSCVVMQTSFLTPPMAPTLFYMKAVSPPEIDFVRDIIYGVIPFVILQLVCLFIIWLYPDLVTWLPKYLFG